MKPVFEKVTPELLDIMPYEYPGKAIEVTIETQEFTCLCPWTGLPDTAQVTIMYTPDKKVIELKSLKFYLQSFRMVGMVHESVVNRLLADLSTAVKPRAMQVTLVFGVRGGITTTVKAAYKK